MNIERLEKIYEFLQAAEQLKDTLRSGFTRQSRRESTSDHTWRLCLMVLCFEKELGQIDLLKLLKLCIIHDLGEAISGDVPATQQDPLVDKSIEERKDFMLLCEPLPDDLKVDMLALWDEYDQKSSKEAILAKGFDKIETIMQHNIGAQGLDFDHAFNLTYGKKATDGDALLRDIRAFVDQKTNELIR